MAFTDTVNETASIVGSSRSSFLGRLKEEFIPAWEDHVHTKIVIASLLAKKKGTMGGRRSLTSVMSAYPQSAGIALFEGDTLPTPRTGEYFNPSIFSRAIYSRLRWTGHVERAARKGDKVAWSQPRTEDLRTARIQFELNVARMLYLGPRQLIGTISAYTDSGSPNLLTVYGRDARTSQAADRAKFGTHYIRKNMSLWSVATVEGAPTNTGEVYVTAIDNSTPTAPTLTLDTDITTDPSDGHFLIPYGARKTSMGSEDADSDSDHAGINGLMNLAVDRNVKSYVYGLARSSYPTLEAVMINNGSSGVRPFNEDYVTLAVDRIGDDGTGDDPEDLLCHKSIRREYVKEVKGDRRFPEVIKQRGFGALKQTVGDLSLTLQTDRDCMPGVMWVLESDGFGWFSEADLQMVDDEERFVADKDAHEIVMVKAGNLATRKPHNNAMIDDIQYSVNGLTDI